MKTINKLLLYILPLSMVLSSCVDDDDINQMREAPAGPARLDIVVADAEGVPVSDATVTLFGNSDDFFNEENAIATFTTDADGIASIEPEVVESERGVFWFDVAKGNLRNWNSRVSTPFMYWSEGPTRIKTALSTVSQPFINLQSTDWQLTSFTLEGLDILVAVDDCETDDIFRFRKDGKLIRFEGANACTEPRAQQLPVSTEGEVWSPWSLINNATGIEARSFDPFDQSEGEDVEADISTTPTTVTIDYGDGEVATLQAI